MEKRIALGLITCERFDYTRKTLESLAKFNDLSRFLLLHGDDASADDRVVSLAMSFGFSTYRNFERHGVMSIQSTIAGAAERADCDWCLILQNDQEWARPFPWELWEYVAGDPTVYCLRLYGKMKDRGALGHRQAGEIHKGTGANAGWRRYEGPEEAAQIGSIHWSSQPSVTKTEHLVWLLDGATRESEVRERSGQIDLMTVRPVENVTWHIGEERTPDFKR